MDSSPPPAPMVPDVEEVAPATGPAVDTPMATEQPVAGPSSTPVPTAPKRIYKRPKQKLEGLLSYTSAHVPGLYNIKNPAGDFVQRESNVDVVRQVSLARVAMQKTQREEEKQRLAAEETVAEEPLHPLYYTLVIHPGSRNLRFGRASEFYPHEVPNCIARPGNAAHRGRDPPVPGSRAKRISTEGLERREAKQRRIDDGRGSVSSGDEDLAWQDPLDAKIGYLRDYLKARLRANKLRTDPLEGSRVSRSNAKARPEPIPEHNDPFRIDYTLVEDKNYFVGQEALKLPESSGYKIRYPILNRMLNTRDWQSPQLLLDDIALILQDSLKKELNIAPRDFSKYSVVFLVPDHGDRLYVQEMTGLLLGEMGFKEIAIHQESFAAIFSAGMSSACVLDMGAQQTSISCVDEGLINPDTRMVLSYGGDDITAAFIAMLQKSNFPYKELDLSRPLQWQMMDNLKIKTITLEEHLVASTSWDFHVLKEVGLTQKYPFRTYDENVLAPLCLFDTRMIDFTEKKGEGRFAIRNTEDVDDMLTSSYDEPTGAMRACTTHLFPQAAPVVVAPSAEAAQVQDGDIEIKVVENTNGEATATTTQPNGGSNSQPSEPVESTEQTGSVSELPPTNGDAPQAQAPPAESSTAAVEAIPQPEDREIVYEASTAPLDAAIAASIGLCATEAKAKAAASTILLIGGSSSIKGLGAFLQERLPPLLRAKGLPIQDVSIVLPPRNINPRFVSWKGGSVMCNLESMQDMWIQREEWDAIGARALKDRCLFL